MCHLCATNRARGKSGLALPQGEVPGRKSIAPFVSSNKGGVPVTRLQAFILLRDRLPAFTIQTTTLGQTPHLSGGIGGLGNARVPIQSRGGRRFVSLPSRGVRGNGGVLFLPPAGSNTVRLYAWNVERAGLSRHSSNESHAETQFLNWLSGHIRQFPGFLGRIWRIHIFLNNSPCGGCTEDLCRFVQRNRLQHKVSIRWTRNYDKGTSSADNRRRLQSCGLQVPAAPQHELLFETKPRLGIVKDAKQQAHTYMFDTRVHSSKPKAVNRRLERLLKDPPGRPASLLSRVFSSPHNRSRVKRLFQRSIDQGNFTQRKGGGYESVLSFKHPTGWSYGKQVNRLKASVDTAGNWHYYPVP
jgi:hypothetical protein